MSTNFLGTLLAACLRDPAWLPGRQWQMGEFEGVDAGSPAFVQIGSHTAAPASTQVGAATQPLAAQPLAAQALLEPLMQAEPFTPDLATRVEAGQCFEVLLAQAGVAASVRDQYRTTYALAAAGADADASTTAFLRICAGRAVDGVALFQAASTAPGGVPAGPVLDPSVQPAVKAALAAFVEWVTDTWGGFGVDEPPAWHPTRLQCAMGARAGAALAGTLQISREWIRIGGAPAVEESDRNLGRLRRAAVRGYDGFALPPMHSLRHPLEIHQRQKKDSSALDHSLAERKAGRRERPIGFELGDHQPLAWIQSLSNTQRAYRKEAERFMLRAMVQQRKALSSITHED